MGKKLVTSKQRQEDAVRCFDLHEKSNGGGDEDLEMMLLILLLEPELMQGVTETTLTLFCVASLKLLVMLPPLNGYY